jgi:hypothetical protein
MNTEQAVEYLNRDTGEAPCCPWGRQPDAFHPAILGLAELYAASEGVELSAEHLEAAASVVVNTGDTEAWELHLSYPDDIPQPLGTPPGMVRLEIGSPGCLPDTDLWLDADPGALVDELTEALVCFGDGVPIDELAESIAAEYREDGNVFRSLDLEAGGVLNLSLHSN